MLEGNGVYSQEDIAKIQKANPNLRVLSEKIIYADSRNVEDGRSTQSVLMSALDGFNIVRYQVFTFKMNDKGEAIDKDGNLVQILLNWYYLVRMVKSTLERISPM